VPGKNLLPSAGGPAEIDPPLVLALSASDATGSPNVRVGVSDGDREDPQEEQKALVSETWLWHVGQFMGLLILN
jgi:hypothetical protein